MSRVSKAVEKAVYARDGYRCVHCGAVDGLSLQHRRNAGMGGSKRAHTPANLIIMCLAHNQLLEANARAAETGRFYGWKLRQHLEPLAVPVFYVPLGGWFWLDDSGGRRDAEPPVPVVDDVPF